MDEIDRIIKLDIEAIAEKFDSKDFFENKISIVFDIGLARYTFSVGNYGKLECFEIFIELFREEKDIYYNNRFCGISSQRWAYAESDLDKSEIETLDNIREYILGFYDPREPVNAGCYKERIIQLRKDKLKKYYE